MKKPSLILSELHHNQTVSVSKDQDIIVQLEENGSTGYLWRYEPLMVNRIQLVDDAFIRDADQLIGGPGMTSMRFKLLVDSGEVKLWFNLLRPWMADEDPQPRQLLLPCL